MMSSYNLLVITWSTRALLSSHIRHARRLTVNFRKSHPHKIGSAPEETYNTKAQPGLARIAEQDDAYLY